MVSFLFLFSMVFPSLIPSSKISLSGDNTPNPANSIPSILWTTNGIPINTANSSQKFPRIVSDGVGGAIIVWNDERNLPTTGIDIYAQRMDSNGVFLWDPNGIAISTVDGDQSLPELVSDGDGGAIIIWQDERNRPGTEIDIYAQRINSSGASLWTPNGTSICSADLGQQYAKVMSDGTGGAIITWYDDRGNGIYAQKINSSGNIQWILDGILVAQKAERPQFISDGEGGTVIVWEDRRLGNLGVDIYLQKFNSSGDPQWNLNGMPISTEKFDQNNPRLVGDGAGNIIIVWDDDRKHYDSDIFVQKVNTTGDIQWAPNGTAICTINNYQNRPEIVTDGAGGAIISWIDLRTFAETETDIYIQRINSTGDALWAPNGTAINTAVETQGSVGLVKDGTGGAYITWDDDRGFLFADHDIYIQSINNMGVIQWAPNGTAITQLNSFQSTPQIINDQGKITIVWEDKRNDVTTGTDIYAHKVVDNMRPTSNQLSSVGTTLYTNETIDWVLTDDWGEGQYRVKANDTAGNYIIWQDWQPWTNNTSLDIPINRTQTGIFNYTIEFYDTYNLYGNPNTVIVTVEEGIPPEGPGPGEGEETTPAISFGIYFTIPLLFGIILVALKSSKKYHKQKT